MQAQTHVESTEELNNGISTVKSIDSSVFDNFKKLTNQDETDRINASLYLLQHFTKIRNEQKDSGKEFQYALKRLIRGLGASTTTSRTGFFTTFVGFLKLFLHSEFDVATVLGVCKKQLKIGKKISNKEDSDAVVGQILACGALIRSNNISNVSSENLKEIVEILTVCSRHRTYHNSLAFSFIVELIGQISENQFIESVWPLLQSELKKSWNKQTINTVNCLVVSQRKFPSILNSKYFKDNFNGSQLLNSVSSQYLFKLFWDNSNSINMITHPSYENFASYISNCKYLEEFWIKQVNEKLSNKNKLIEIITLKILTDILLNYENNKNDKKIKISNLFTENFIKMIIASLKNLKIKKDETLKAIYDDFFDALIKYCTKSKIIDSDENYNIICKLILYPGIINIEKYTNTRIIHQIIITLNENNVKNLFEIYKNIFLDITVKNPNDKNELWLNYEKQNAGYMLQTLINHKTIQIATTIDWKIEQLKFMMKFSLFHTTKNGEILNNKKIQNNDNGNDCETKSSSFLNDELSNQLKNIFYTSLQLKYTKLNDQKRILMELIESCNEILQKNNFSKYLKIKIDDNIEFIKIWNDMYNEVHENTNKKYKDNINKKYDKLELVFHILLLHMGLQLFKEPDMAKTAILDLKKCLEKSKMKKFNIKTQNKLKKIKENGKISTDNGNDGEEEPEWIEVVIDLFLHLLSQNVSALRIVVDSLFPHLCDKLTLTSIHQILQVLDMKDGNNPLSEENEDNSVRNDSEGGQKIKKDENDHDDNDDEKIDSSSESESDNDNDDGGKNEDEDDEDDDDEEIMGEEEEDENTTVADRLRNAVSVALSSLGDSIGNDDDQNSINLDDMTEEEGKRLDEALSNVFRAIKGSEKNSNKRSKGYRVKTTTLMHFRIRVLDLIEIYIQHHNQQKFPKMLFTIEIMLALYNMIEYCTNEKELQPLTAKLDKVLTKLTTIKQFSISEKADDDEDLNLTNLCDYLRLIIEKKVKAPIADMNNKFKSKCCIFLINCCKILHEKDSKAAATESTQEQENNDYITKILNLLQEYLNDFIKSRNPVITITLLNDLFKIRWHGIWKLAKFLTCNGLTETTRTFRRIQILELLDQLYKNHDFIKQNLKLVKKDLKSIEKHLQNYILTSLNVKSSSTTATTKTNEISQREFSSILNVYCSINKCHNKITSLNLHINKDETLEWVQTIRKKIKLENAHSYIRFCSIFGLKPLRNSEIITTTTTTSTTEVEASGKFNGKHVNDSDIVQQIDPSNNEEDKDKNTNNKKNKKEKHKKNKIQNNEEKILNGENIVQLKRKNNSNSDLRKEKKLKKEERMRIASEGLNGNLSFVKFSTDIEVMDE